MSATENEFRTAVFGGFHKTDVLHYIEKTVQTYTQKQTELQKQLDEAQKAGVETGERLSAAAIMEEGLVKENQRLKGELAANTQALEETRLALEGKSEQLTSAQQECAALQKKLKKLEPSAAAYESVKDRTAGIELEAHHRANVIADEAEEQARQARQVLEQWLYKVQAGYDRLRTDLDATISHAAGELDRVEKSLKSMAGEFDARDADLESLVGTFHALDAPKAPRPLPLDEA